MGRKTTERQWTTTPSGRAVADGGNRGDSAEYRYRPLELVPSSSVLAACSMKSHNSVQRFVSNFDRARMGKRKRKISSNQNSFSSFLHPPRRSTTLP